VTRSGVYFRAPFPSFSLAGVVRRLVSFQGRANSKQSPFLSPSPFFSRADVRRRWRRSVVRVRRKGDNRALRESLGISPTATLY
jgi:hypothetical protein